MNPRQDLWLRGREGRLRLRRWWMSHPRAGLVLVPGLGDHSLRYGHVAEGLGRRGVGVVALDLPGHGESDGRRGDVRQFESFASDLGTAVSHVRGLLPEGSPLVLLGHSMGGLVVLRYLQGEGRGRPGIAAARSTFGPPRGVARAVLTAPWLATAHPVPWWKRMAAAVLLRTLPHVAFRAALNASELSRDPEMQRVRAADPWIHDRCSPRLFRGVEEAQTRAMDEAPGVKVPILLVVPEADRVADPRQALRLASRLPPRRGTVIQLRNGVHEPLHDLERDAVIGQVGDWVLDGPDGSFGQRVNTQRIG